ncbi:MULTISPECIES: AI-2E family transporter [unclassified Legionella]|uniref:AI-2E family transporter n=1 Tax=unclassified Legionella TaxID=2622702 RepID=UPI0010557D58|nr:MULTISPECIES: AI-2E family transporter [unclassified Legionella]MDI9818393.1 AI-2E family transporter [Legionella sp. PL877]
MNKSRTDKSQAGWEIKALLFLAISYTIYIAKPVLFPLLFSFFLYLLLTPFMGLLQLIKIPKILASAIIAFLLLGIISAGITFLMEPASRWLDKAPENLQIIEKKFSIVKKPLERISEAFEKAQDITSVNKEKSVEITAENPSLGHSLFDLTTNIIFLIFITIVLLFFLLIYLPTLFKNLQKTLSEKTKDLASNFLLGLEKEVSNYLAIFTLICIFVGFFVGFSLWLLGIPNAILWGVMATLLNFIPYLGPATGIAIIFLVSLLTFDSYLQILLPPAVYLLINILEGQIITPILIGDRLNLNPLLVFFSIFFWAWLWGVSGVLISIPLLATIKIMIENIPALSKYSLLLEK